jgi:hypothetical protein
MPGSTTQRLPATSSSTTWSRYLEQSTIKVELMVCPHCEVPPPRAVTLTPSSRAIESAYSTSLIERGATTPSGMI